MPIRPRLHLAAPAVLALAVMALPAAAETSPWYIGLSQAFTYESNLYRIDSATPLDADLSRSDTISSTSLVGGLDQPIGRQRVFGSLLLSTNRYANNDELDGSSYRVTGGLDWSTIERFSGNVNFSASQNQRQFNVDTAPGQVETQKNDETIEQINAVFRAGVVTRLTMEAGLGWRQVGYSADSFAGSEYDQASGSLGVRYRPGIATFGAAYRHAQSDYFDNGSDLVNDNTRDSIDFTVNWPASGNSSLYARISPTRVDYDNFSERDFDGVTGALSWDWTPTGKLKTGTRLVYDIGQDSNFERFGDPSSPTGIGTGTNITARTSTELRLSADYEATAKIGLSTSLGYTRRSLDRELNLSGQTADAGDGSDNTTLFTLGARWSPTRSVQVGCEYGHDRRSASGGLTQDYSANTFNCFGQFVLQ
jgi:hypothetical protein